VIHDSWEKKLPMSATHLECTWLYHEIGRCHLELGNYEDAKSYASKSMEEADAAEDLLWQLNASVLKAQANGRFICELQISKCLNMIIRHRFKTLSLSVTVNK